MTLLAVLSRIQNYEYSIYLQILKLWIYQPQTNNELRQAVDIWCKDRNKGIETYGHISLWDTTKIRNMSSLFECKCRIHISFHDELCECTPISWSEYFNQKRRHHECFCEYHKQNIISSKCICGKKYFNENIWSFDWITTIFYYI